MAEIFDPHRLQPLAKEVRLDSRACAFRVDREVEKELEFAQYSGGRDATYITVSRRLSEQTPPSPLAVMVRYAPFVEGTALIYDATAETMQGKARPFICDLTAHRQRVYAVLPVQIEVASLWLDRAGIEYQLHVAFLDACGAVIEAALPFSLIITGANERLPPPQYFSTNRTGRFSHLLSTSTRQITLQSCLTGEQRSLTI